MIRFPKIFVLIYLVIGFSAQSYSQLFGPGRDWSTTTQYLDSPSDQDSIFVFFSPKLGSLKAKFSDGSVSSFKWFKYNKYITDFGSRFEQFSTENGVVESNLTNLSNGGYRVEVTNGSSITEVYTIWLFIDNVVIPSITVNNTCDYLRLDVVTLPDRFTIVYESFTYWDISRPNHPENNKYGRDYFKNIVWSASDSRITVPTSTNLYLIIEDTAPLYNSTYSIQNANPFGRNLSATSSEVLGIAVKADFLISINKDGAWEVAGSEPNGEAPLELKFESESINADSLFWNILNDEELFLRGGDSIIWSDSSLFTERIDAYPPKEIMVPGFYPVEHIAVKSSSGCRDTLKIYVEVDSSMIKPDAIPNVFTPNDDESNQYFKFIDPETNIASIKQFNIYILSRWGNLVYEYHGDPKTWEGWNGRIQGDRSDAPEGVYYYIIEAIGWDGKKFSRGKYKGFLHLFRGN